MGYLPSEKPPAKWSAAYFKMFVEKLRVAVNDLDINNFPTGINGYLINDRTVAWSKLIGMGFLNTLKELEGIELQQTIIALAYPYAITTITADSVGGYVMYSSVFNKPNVKLIFEVVGGSKDATSTATFELHGINGKLAEVTTNAGTIEFLRSAEFNPPEEGQTLLVKAKTSDTTKAANLLSARLIIKIQ